MSLHDVNLTIPVHFHDDRDDENDFNDDDDDIYRGSIPPSSPRPSSLSSSSSSSSSSSGSFLGVARLGAIANVLEHAITHWARGGSSSSSSSSSRSSINTLSRSQMARRRRRRPSMGNFHSDQSERDIAARISLIKAREELRLVPRQFCLYLPPAYRAFVAAEDVQQNVQDPQRVTRSSSLPFVLGQLDSALRKASKARRNEARSRAAQSPSPSPSPGPLHQDFMLPESMKIPSRPASFTDLTQARSRSRKGKKREVQAVLDLSTPNTWYLDVASPTSADMQSIGKLLHLHPLTLEDILQQDPREKVEVFSRLGYYFNTALHDRLATAAEKGGDHTANRPDEGILGEANLYVVVFNEGICSFHFTDMSEHTDRVRNRLFKLEGLHSLSSSWIAHGLLDSVVDSFFPFLEEIEKEVMAIEDLVFENAVSATRSETSNSARNTVSSPAQSDRTLNEKDEMSSISEKTGSPPKRTTRFELPRPPLPMLLRRLRRFGRRSHTKPHEHEESSNSPSPTSSTLRRMAKARRLVTSLTRLLAVKSDIILQIRKRLLLAGAASPEDKREDAAEIAIHMGDVHDHILTLQHSLAHYERMLSQSHPIYLAQLRTTAQMTKSAIDMALIFLTVVSVGVLCVQPIIGVVSTNVTVPTNGKTPAYPLNGFGIVVALVFLVLVAYLFLARYWWRRAKRRHDVAL
ncbi:hypothetical protein BDZ89DRAFT_1059044 [Hymenopellis radicata]|nr:hypothetical protein BDZ89DRAFT_1059044 [Hymenopellis radicata]